MLEGVVSASVILFNITFFVGMLIRFQETLPREYIGLAFKLLGGLEVTRDLNLYFGVVSLFTLGLLLEQLCRADRLIGINEGRFKTPVYHLFVILLWLLGQIP